MDEVFGFVLRIIFEALFELVVHGIGNGTKRLWWLLRGKKGKRLDSLEARRLYHEKRMQRIEELRKLRYRRKYGKSDQS